MAATEEQIKNLAEHFSIDETFKDFEYGGIIQFALMTLRIEETPENKKILDNIFWGNADPYTVVRTQRYDVNDETATKSYYTIPTTSLEYLNGQQIIEVVQKCMDIVVDVESKPCPHDTLLQIVLIVLGTIITISTGGLTGSAMYLALTAMFISLSITLGLVSHPNDVKNARILTAVLSLGTSGYSVYTAGSNATIAATTNFALQVGSTCLEVVNIESQYQFQRDMQDVINETKEIKAKSEAEIFEEKLHYVYSESFDAVYREGHERDPYEYVKKLYDYTKY